LARLFAGGPDDRSPRRGWTDRLLGIAIGILLGLGVLIYFVFVHSEGTIDAPKVNSSGSAQTLPAEGTLPAHPGSPEEPAEEAPKPKNEPTKMPVPVVKVIGGAPQIGAGPKQLNFTVGEKVRFEIETNEPFTFEIKGLGVTQSIEASSIVSFKATKAGQFPVISTTTLIGVADLLIKKK
jgi:heme/copper-type cytochrome/quinol oxidase subunit 2